MRRYGPEFTSKAMLEWSYRRGIKLNFIRQGKPTDNAFIESFNGKFRDECLNQRWFTSLNDAKEEIEPWRKEYNIEVNCLMKILTWKTANLGGKVISTSFDIFNYVGM